MPVGDRIRAHHERVDVCHRVRQDSDVREFPGKDFHMSFSQSHILPTEVITGIENNWQSTELYKVNGNHSTHTGKDN